MQGRESEAEAILNRLHSDSSDPENEYARAEYFQIVRQLHIDKTLGNSSYRKRAIMAMAITFFVQSSGDLVINSQFTSAFSSSTCSNISTDYGPTLYKNLGYGTTQQLLYSSAWLTFTLGMSVIAIPFVDRMPRNEMIACGLWGCMATLIVEAALVATYVPSQNKNALRAAVAIFFVFQVFDTGMLNGILLICLPLCFELPDDHT